MYIGQVIGLFGWITAISFGIALANFFLKRINKHWISKLPKEHEKWVKLYRTVMKYFIKYHKLAGMIAVVSVLTHFGIAFNNGYSSITGFTSAVLMITMALLGSYGAFIKKKSTGAWILVHRSVAFLMILSISVHILTR